MADEICIEWIGWDRNTAPAVYLLDGTTQICRAGYNYSVAYYIRYSRLKALLVIFFPNE